MDNRIYRSRETKMLAGVCGGIADMFNLDPTLVRLITVALILFSGMTFILVYVLCAIIIPMEPTPGYILSRHRRSKEPAAPFTETPASEPSPMAQAQPDEPQKTDAPEEVSIPPESVNPGTGIADENEPAKDKPATDSTNYSDSSAGTESLSNDDTVINTESDRY